MTRDRKSEMDAIESEERVRDRSSPDACRVSPVRQTHTVTPIDIRTHTCASHGCARRARVSVNANHVDESTAQSLCT